MPRLLFVCFLCLGFFTVSYGQSFSNLRSKNVWPADTIFLDSLSIQAGSVVAPDDSLFLTEYSLDPAKSLLIRNPGNKNIRKDSVLIRYRVLAINLRQAYYSRSKRFSGPEERGISNPFVFTPAERLLVEPGFSGLTRNGSISRGISLGNNQDMSVNSTLNLQLAGKLSPEIDISAAITDDNIPIQPDGNTQQLQDFDRVYIQLSNARSRLIVGDFQVGRPDGYFMNFNKRLQGAGFQTSYPLNLNKKKTGMEMKTGLNAAIARGRFHRNSIQGQEGNQGPYRLQGASNEQYIVVLSGSEKIYIDGKLLKRGQEFDYIIDYNAAEITFTARNLITKDRRIFVEFEYADRNYARTLLHFNQELSSKRVHSRFNFYSEQDSKNQPLQQKLDSTGRFILQQAGDQLQQAIIPSADSTGFNALLVQYRMRDTLVDGIVYPKILEYSTNPEEAVYRATFTNVGQNKGHYAQINSAANGRVYQWVAPLNGIPQGNYEPLIQLIPPIRKQMLSWGNDIKVSEHLMLYSELAWSGFDQNTFSTRDSHDDQGYALRFAASDTRKLSKDSIPITLQTTLSYEQVDRNFSAIERFRNVEFDRDWNLLATHASRQTEYLPRIQINLKKGENMHSSYLFTAFIRGTESRASQHQLQVRMADTKQELRYSGSLTNSAGMQLASGFYRHKSLVSRKIGKVRIGYEDELEQNLLSDRLGDTMQRSSYRFYDRQIGLSRADTSSGKLNLVYRVRTDMGLPFGLSTLKRYAKAEQYGFNMDLHKTENFRLSNLFSYRKLSVSDTTFHAQKSDQTLLNRIELSLRFWKSALSSGTFYEFGSGQESRKEFSYLEVQPGQGVYQWTDYNSNGIRELNEFELAAFPDQARFIRIFTPTRDFIRVYYNQFSEILNLRAPSGWQNEKGIKKILARFSLQSALRMDSRSTMQNMWQAMNPLSESIADSSLITLNQSYRNSLFFNRSDPGFGMDLNWQKLASRALLNNGIESKTHTYFQGRARWNPGSKIGLSAETRNGTKISEAAYFGSRNYRIRYMDYEPVISYLSGNAFRVNLKYRYGKRSNAPEAGGEKALIHKAGVEFSYNVVTKGSFQLSANMIQIGYTGSGNTPVAFEMLEGLKSGKNYTWSVSYQRTLSNNMQISFSYDGRKTPETPVVHIGNAQVRVFF